ncbi:MAG: hypothetical protein JWO83_538 [Caulobacteraceae bacterium]|nr:hypothetical protein [Caulobacteraceae bacterium]
MGTFVAFRDSGARLAAASVRLWASLVLLAATPAMAQNISASISAHAHEGVASCAGSACHGRAVASAPDIRHDEIRIWQDSTGPAGAHSRAWRVLAEPRAQAIATRLGLGRAQDAPACLGCHADHPAARGALFHVSDGVGCEACHGGSSDWLASHYALGVKHRDNVAKGMIPLEDAKVRAAVCLDCHFGAAGTGQFVTHQIMSAGHPRIAFELDLFSTLQKHYDLGANYAARKPIPSGVKLWAVGQAIALDRSLTLFSDPRRGQEGAFPEFYFFDCHSCHRTISDDPRARPTAVMNPGRPIPSGTVPYNDENMIMLSAAAAVAAPKLAAQFDADCQAFHIALATDRTSAIRAAGQLARSARALSNTFAAREFGRAEILGILGRVISDAQGARYTDYAGSAQAVMAIDTLLNALVTSGEVDAARARALRPEIDRAYRAVNDPNGYRPAEFRAAIARIALAARTLG